MQRNKVQQGECNETEKCGDPWWYKQEGQHAEQAYKRSCGATSIEE